MDGHPLENFVSYKSVELMAARNNYVFRTGKLERAYFKKSIKDNAEFFSVGRNVKMPKAKIVVEVG